MLIVSILFWAALALDAAIIAVFFVLGLAAAGPSKSNPLSVVFLMLILPGIVLVALAAWFLAIKAPVFRIVVLLIAASPALLVIGGQIATLLMMRANPEEANKPVSFKPISTAPLDSAIRNGDVNAVKEAAVQVRLRGSRNSGSFIITALYRLEKAPERIDILEAVLEAGADPNDASSTMPLEAAIKASKKIGNRPIEVLLKAGANPNKLNSLGDPVYFEALAKTVELEILQLLLDRGANPKVNSYRGETAEARANSNNNPKAAALLGKL
ncbi:MAG: hypothetical protein FJW36_03760 [Acidobacteria bacterium]|nr:hypothetical protein [Acidobacteriota bacterium]